MLESPPRESKAESKEEERLASCFNCKKSKVKCVRPEGSTTCGRCAQRKLECTAPLFHVGRHKGVKNKHSGLEKAVIQIEQALKRTNPGNDQIQNSEQSTELRYLLERSRSLLSAERKQKQSASFAANRYRQDGAIPSPQLSSGPSPQATPPSRTESLDGSMGSHMDDEQLNLDDAENPLQLLARTSELLSSADVPGNAPAPGYFPYQSLPTREATHGHDYDGKLATFFGRSQARLDVGLDLDPVELGLLTFPEAQALFKYFYEKLSHTRWGVDPVLHTVEFVRKRSAFLFTSICAASALFQPSLEALHKRLSAHQQYLADLVITKRCKSVEIVLAFMVSIPWLPAGEHWADDETSTYISMALSIALDLYLNKLILPSAPETPFSRDNIPTSDHISSRRALIVDGFPDLDPLSELGRRLLRRRERTWLSLFVLERGAALARGRSYMLPMSPLIENCDHWHLCELADRWDGSIVSVAVLRRDLAKLIANIRGICDSYVNGVSDNAIVEKLKKEINMFFDRWYQTWPMQIGDRDQFTLPPYVEILASHTRLSMYSSVINYSSAPSVARHFFRSAGLSSALNVLRVAVQGEGQLRSMPNNTAIMISFAACFALRVSTAADGRGSSLAPSIRALIAETIDVLDRIGSAPVQRKGLSCLFAGQLRQILKHASHAVRTAETGRMTPGSSGMMPDAGHVYTNPNPGHGLMPNSQMPPQLQMHGGNLPPDYMLFSTMSNDQLNEAINNTDVVLDAIWDDIQFQQASELDWMDWSTFVQ